MNFEDASHLIAHVSLCHCVDIVGDMMNNLSVPRSRQKLVEKVVELGLVGDRRELRKKRQKKDGSMDGTNKNSRWRKNGDDLRELSDLVSDEQSSSESMYVLLVLQRLMK